MMEKEKINQTVKQPKTQINKETDKVVKSDRHDNKFYNFFMPVEYPTRKKQIITSLVVFGVLFLGIFIYISVSYAVNKTSYIDNPYNRQEANLLKQNLRGAILSSEGKTLAYTDVYEDGTQHRVYPYGAMFAHAVGYSDLSKTGIEKEANYYLVNSGDDLLQRAVHKTIDSWLNAYTVGYANGNTVWSTLRLDLQQVAYDGLGNQKGAVIVTEVKTGKILAMVSKPDFDPQTIEEDWIDLTANKSNSALLNRCLQGLYPPGSTFKIFTAKEYLDEGYDTNEYSFNCNGSYSYESSKISCYHGTAHGTLDFKASFAKSCNSSFANIGMSLNKNKFSAGLESLLFNEELPSVFIDVAPAVSTFDISTDNKQMQTSIGQGDTSVTPYHINLVTMAIANKGKIMKPYIIDKIEDTNDFTVKSYKASEYKTIITEDEAAFLKDLMVEVVESGTASALKNENYTLAGKTGSAEYNDFGDSHAWFTCFAPAEDPEIAVTVIVEKGGTGSSTAAPLAKDILDVYFGVK